MEVSLRQGLAGLSMDVDSVASHLEGYGFVRPEDDGSAYQLAIPRALDLFDELKAHCTFFLVVSDAIRFPGVVREIVARGHEVASHSMSHQLPFAGLDHAALVREIAESKTRLEDVSGAEIHGFRAPSWDVSEEMFAEIAAAGYEYDASSFPSILLPLLRWTIARRSTGGRTATRSDAWEGVFGPTRPYLKRTSEGSLWEIPMCTTPLLRLPYYHTMALAAPRPLNGLVGWLARQRRGVITYQFHAVDFLEAVGDGLNQRIVRHPGMELPLARKLELAAQALRNLRSARSVVTLLDIIGTLGEA